VSLDGLRLIAEFVATKKSSDSSEIPPRPEYKLMGDQRPTFSERPLDVDDPGPLMRTGAAVEQAGDGLDSEGIPRTRPSLFTPLRDGDQKAWREFVELYGPVISGRCRSFGVRFRSLQLREDELVSDILVKLFNKLPRFRYDPDRGRFRNWLGKVIMTTVLDHIRGVRADMKRGGRGARGTGDSAVQELLTQVPAPAALEEAVEELSEELTKKKLYEEARHRVRVRVADRTWRAFEETVTKRRNPKDVARDLDMRVGTVYQNKRQVIRMLREEVQRRREGTAVPQGPDAE
jgi:RNA polymerase sigma-70 factor (ECF subfamily)